MGIFFNKLSFKIHIIKKVFQSACCIGIQMILQDKSFKEMKIKKVLFRFVIMVIYRNLF